MQSSAVPVIDPSSALHRPQQLGRLHVIAGLTTLAVFLMTGIYMKTHSLDRLPDSTRLLYRSRHIYLLMSGLLNLMVGLQYREIAAGKKRLFGGFGSALLLVAPLFI